MVIHRKWLVAALLTLTVAAVSSQQCGNVLDLAFIIDSSGSITDRGPGNWVLIREFIARMSRSFNVGQASNQVRVGVASFSFEGQLEWDLNDPQTANNDILESSILSIVHLASFTNTPDGLMVARQQIFNTAGDRAGVPNVAILITDGESNRRVEDLAFEANALKTQGEGARVIVLGITNAVNQSELQRIATSDDLVYNSEGFSSSQGIFEDILSSACVGSLPAVTAAPTPAPTQAVTTTSTQTGCQAVLDLAIILDSSGSITDTGAGNWNLTRQFVARISRRFNVGQAANQVRIGIASFSGEGQLEWDLNDPQTANNDILESSILSIVHLASFTNTPDGLMVARQQIFNTAGDRPGVPNVAILLTDGQTNRRVEDLAFEANALKTQGEGARVFAVGVTNAVNITELEKIATSPTDVFTVDDFSALDSTLDTIVAGSCVTPERK